MGLRAVPERNDIVRGRLLKHDIETFSGTSVYIEKDGEGPVITDHFADRRSFVISGACELELEDASIAISAGTEFSVPKGVPARMIGRCSMLTVIEPILVDRFVTFNDQRLSFSDRRALRKTNKAFEVLQRPYVPLEEVVCKIAKRMMQVERLFDDMKDAEGVYDRRSTALRR